MKPVDFDERNIIFTNPVKDQPALPAHKTTEGQVISFWQLTWKERFKILLTGKLYLSTMTYNKPMYPLFPTVNREDIFED